MDTKKIKPITVKVMDTEGIEEIYIGTKTYVSEEFDGALGKAFGPGEALLFFANLVENIFTIDLDCVSEEEIAPRQYLRPYHEILSKIEKGSEIEDLDEYLRDLDFGLSKEYGQQISDIIMIDSVNKHYYKSFKSIGQIKYQIIETLENLIDLSNSYAGLVYKATSEGHKHLYPLAFQMLGGIKEKISYGALMGRKSDEFVVIDCYSISSAVSVIDFELITMIKEKTVVKLCQNCNRFFVPHSRSDEIYCNHINETGRSCKEVGFENKMKKDEAFKAYRTIYKTQNARKQRNSHLPDIEVRFADWALYARKEMEKCRAEKISLEEMKSRIAKSDWLSRKG